MGTAMDLKILLLLCFAAAFAPVRCGTKSSTDDERARLPEFLSELDLASLEASEEDVEALKKVVKRLAGPEKNGEYQVYQGVMGKPGVDFPALTTIPATSFSCRGLKGGYYADLETNCQVFHICDNGRKISFLCPNGTIFQQSQLICDWWFKVDCSKSAELYEQSAEQLAMEERKRAEAKKMNSEFHRPTGNAGNSQNYYEDTNYDGRQNGRTNPFAQSATQNQIPQQNAKAQSYDQNTIHNNHNYNVRNENSQATSRVSHPNENYNVDNEQQQRPPNGYKPQLTRGKAHASENYYNLNNLNNRNEKQKSKTSIDRNTVSGPVQKVTPVYTETTTFRTSTSNPIKEYQQFAESAAFVSNRNQNKGIPFNGNQFNSNNNYYTKQRTTSGSGSGTTAVKAPEIPLKSKVSIPAFPGPTFTPIYKPRTTTTSTRSTTPGAFETTTEDFATTTDYYGQEGTHTTDSAVTGSYVDIDYPTTTGYNGNSESYSQYTENFDYNSTYYNDAFHRRQNSFESSTTRPYVNTETYRQNTATVAPSDADFGGEVAASTTASYFTDYRSQNSARTSQTYRQNFIGASTEKPSRATTQGYPQTDKTLSPYDTSFTYQQGKVMSTLGPYVPFTKNYAYSTTTTSTTTTTEKPPVYTATVPTYSSTIPPYRVTPKNVASKGKLPVATSRVRGNAAYLPEKSTGTASGAKKKVSFEKRPTNEREHVLGMLQSLQRLENAAPAVADNSRLGLNIPTSSGPSTLHSLALYFATASENFDSLQTTDHPITTNYEENSKESDSASSVELPSSILTQNTINSYAELFNLNNALETNETTLENESKEANSDDLDLQQSQGPLSGVKKSNGTKLRELAQVFTHALSAYLQDPETFKKVLTEIRPTEPPSMSEDSTTPYPTTQDEFPSVTKEKDEVLDFSDDSNGPLRRKPTTAASVAGDTTYQGYYSSSESWYPTTSTPYSNDAFAYQVNNAFETTGSNDVQNYNGGSSGDYDNYFPPESANRIGGFQNNTSEPYGKHVKPFDATPIGKNYVHSSTPATYLQEQTTVPPEDANAPGGKSSYQQFNRATSSPQPEEINGIAHSSSYGTRQRVVPHQVTSTTQPFRIRYYDFADQPSEESLLTAGNNYNRNANPTTTQRPRIYTLDPLTTTIADIKNSNVATRKTTQTTAYPEAQTNPWTSSPSVTQLWETTVFVDPQRINHGLEPDNSILTAVDPASQEVDGVTTRDAEDASSRRFSSNDDSPTAFTLLPTAYPTENTATPAPTYTTRSSITTTITSSVTSTQNGIPGPIPSVTGNYVNATLSDIYKAKEMFGGLNASSSDALMKVMKQADNNATVRQLVLLLISHCNGPMNKTMEEEKEQLLSALLKLPVNEFSTQESRELVTSIAQLNLPIGNSRFGLKTANATRSTPSSTSSPPSVTTFRNRKSSSRRFRPASESPQVLSRRSDEIQEVAETSNTIPVDETTASDNRALELLRSLYSVAAKWG